MDHFPQGHALLIGIGEYQYSSSLDIPETATDVQEVAKILGDPQACGYLEEHITVLHEATATREAVLRALADLAWRTEPDDTVFIFYSGHGEYGKDRVAYYLTTNDTRIDYVTKAQGQMEAFVVEGTAVSDVELLTALRNVRAQRVFLFFNSCYSGSLTPDTLDADPSEGSSGTSLPDITAAALLATGKGRAVITACREKQLSVVGEGPLTIFGQALVDGLQGASIPNRNGFISLFDLYISLYNRVSTATKPLVAKLRKRQREKHAGDRQEPELTLLKNTGVMAVALHPGTTPPEPFELERVLSADLPVRDIDGASSREAYRRVLTGERSVANLSNIRNSSIVTGDNNKVTNVGDISDNSGQVAIGEGIAQASGGSTASVNSRQAEALPQPKQRLSDMRLVQMIEQAVLPDMLPDLVFALGRYVAFAIDEAQLGKTPKAQVRKLIEICREQNQRSAFIEALLDVNDRLLGTEEEQEAWRTWATEQDQRRSRE